MRTPPRCAFICLVFILYGSTAILSAQPFVAPDFDGDGNSDILWRHKPTGELGVWLIKGRAIVAAGSIGVPPAGVTIAGFGDIDGDSKTDIIFRDSVGGVGTWLMDGRTIRSGGYIGWAPLSLSIAGIADLDGDKKADILWYDASTYAVGAWLLDGLAVKSGVYYGNGTSAIRIGAVTDFDNDQRADVLWVQQVSSGQSCVGTWLLDGLGIRKGSFGGCVAGSVIGAADLVSDFGWYTYSQHGWSDVLWQSDNAQLNISIGAQCVDPCVPFTPGYRYTHYTVDMYPALALDAGTQLNALGDYSGDGWAEMLLRNSAGEVFTTTRTSHPPRWPGDFGYISVDPIYLGAAPLDYEIVQNYPGIATP